MGESERYMDRRLKKMTLGDDSNALMALVAINAMIFISFGLIQVVYYLSQSSDSAFQYEILRRFILPAKLSTLATEPWTVVTYMFVHTGIVYTFINMIWLWVFGSILQDMSGNKNIIPIYLYGGLAGAFVFIAANYAIPQLKSEIEYSTMLGGNASIIAVAVAATALTPNYRFFKMLNGGIPLWILTILYVIIDFAGMGGTAHHLAHLGGGLIGYLFIAGLRKGYDWGKWMNDLYSWFINLFNPDKKAVPTNKIKEKIFYKTGTQKPFEKRSVITQERIDEILDKINHKGYKYLSEEEKNILKKARETDF
jgi:membrane associated rhomboid family serine protease